MKPATPVSQRAELLLLGTGLVLVLYIAANFVYLSVLPWGYSRKHSRVQQGQSGVPLMPPTGGH